jgi:hypothetical protein
MPRLLGRHRRDVAISKLRLCRNQFMQRILDTYPPAYRCQLVSPTPWREILGIVLYLVTGRTRRILKPILSNPVLEQKRILARRRFPLNI